VGMAATEANADIGLILTTRIQRQKLNSNLCQL